MATMNKIVAPKAQRGKKMVKKSTSPVDDYKNMKDSSGKKGTMSGEGTNPPFDKNSPVLPLPGRKAKNMPKAKNGKSFPDLNKDGKITKADILKGRGVIAKSGAALKKQAAIAISMKKAGKTPMKKAMNGYGGKAASMVPPMKKGGVVKKCKYGCK